VIFSIFVCPDKNLIMELCKHGTRIEVLSPAEVREAVKEELTKALAQYA
jgi:predicted DNA-binding transcriptional regulator YafY